MLILDYLCLPPLIAVSGLHKRKLMAQPPSGRLGWEGGLQTWIGMGCKPSLFLGLHS